jgi:hypothetical protein
LDIINWLHDITPLKKALAMAFVVLSATQALFTSLEWTVLQRHTAASLAFDRDEKAAAFPRLFYFILFFNIYNYIYVKLVSFLNNWVQFSFSFFFYRKIGTRKLSQSLWHGPIYESNLLNGLHVNMARSL